MNTHRITSVDRGWIFKDCGNLEALKDAALGERFRNIIAESGFTVYDPIACEKFPGEGGVTAGVIIGESLADIHTWPETSTAHVRLFYCHYTENNDEKAERFITLMREYLKPGECMELPTREFPV